MSDSQPPFSIPGANPSPPPLPPPVPPEPPPPYARPGGNLPPPPKKKSIGLWILFGALGFCILLIAGGTVWGIKSLENVMSKEVTAPPNSGRPTFVELPDGWVKATFPEFPMTVELPMKVVVMPLGESAFEEGEGILTDHFVVYGSQDPEEQCSVVGHWLTGLGMMSNTGEELPTYGKDFIEGMGLEAPRPLSIANKPPGSVALTAKQSFGDDEIRDTSFLFVPFKRGIAVIYVSSSEFSSQDFERIARSVKVDPS